MGVERASVSPRKQFVMPGYAQVPNAGSVLTIQLSQPANGAKILVLTSILR